MSSPKDPLYKIFEQHLFNSMVEDESTTDFLDKVVAEYLHALAAQGSITPSHRQLIETDLKEEVLEMLRKKTYGHFSLTEFRKHKAVDPKTAPPALPPQKPAQKRKGPSTRTRRSS